MRIGGASFRDLGGEDREVEVEAGAAESASRVDEAGEPGQRRPLRDPLLERFTRRTRDELLGLPGMDGPRADAVLRAVAAGEVDHFGDVERTLRDAGATDPAATLRGVYRMEALAHVQAAGLTRGSSMLFLASKPVDASALDLERERARMEVGGARMTAIADPTVEEIEALVSTGAFRGVWVAGHGHEGKLILADEDGGKIDVGAEAFAKAVSASPEVRFVMASVCSGAKGAQSVIRTIAAHGPSAAGYARPVRDEEAIAMSAAMARALSRGVSFQAAVAAAYYTVYPHDGMPVARDGIVRPGNEYGRGSFVRPEDDRDLLAARGAPAPWVPFVQFARGTNDPPATPPPPP